MRNGDFFHNVVDSGGFILKIHVPLPSRNFVV